MKRYYAVEVTRTVTDRRRIIVCAEDIEAPPMTSLLRMPNRREFREPWVNPRTNYSNH
jgi:hypothetical protein